MQWVTIREISNFEGQEVVLKGWLFNKRSSGKIHFLQVRDGSGFIQAVVAKEDVSEEIFNECKKLTKESSLEVVGVVRKEERAAIGYELTVKEVKIINIAEDYPITLKSDNGPDFLMDHRHLWFRGPKQHAILSIRHEITNAARQFLNDRGFTLIESPIITPSTCEGTSELFDIDYFGQPAYLSQTGQLYAEAAAMAFGKVYTFGPTFRAEKSKTRRHLNEFWMLEPEMAFVEHEENLKVQEELIAYIIDKVVTNKKQELKVLGRDIEALAKIKAPFPKVRYTEAIEILNKNGFDDIKWGDDLGAPHEVFLSEQYDGLPVFITHYPKECKAFYMQPDDVDPRTVKCADLLYPGFGEIIGGSERIYDKELMLKRLKEENLPEDIYSWYIDLRKYGSVPHSGFGLGIERMVTVICGNDHIRESIPFARTLTRVTP